MNSVPFFSSVASTLKAKVMPLTNFTWKMSHPIRTVTQKSFQFSYVSKIFIEKKLKSLKRNKATGIDDLPPGMLKDSASVISQPLCHLINLSLDSGTVIIKHKNGKLGNTTFFRKNYFFSLLRGIWIERHLPPKSTIRY